MNQETVTERASEAQTQVRQEAAERLAGNTTLKLKSKTPDAAAKRPSDHAGLQRDTPPRG